MKCYIASPFFNDEQIKEVENIKTILLDLNIKFFSPKDFAMCKKDASNKERLLIFKKNLIEIKNSDFIVCNTNNKDMGSIFEAGYAFAMNKPIIYFNATLEGDFNLMLAQSGIAFAANILRLKDLIKKFKKEKNFYEKYKGEIE